MLWPPLLKPAAEAREMFVVLFVIGAAERTRTSTPVTGLAPQASASTIPPPGRDLYYRPNVSTTHSYQIFLLLGTEGECG